MQRTLRIAISLLAVWTMAAGDARAADPRLIDAVKSGNREAVRMLLHARADVNAAEVDGTTALHWAVRADDLELVRLLIAAGAKAAATNRYGVMPLSLAASNGNARMIETLIAAGADPNSALPEGETVLMTAARTGSGPAVEALLDHGADVNAKERWQGETALMWAAAENHAAAVTLLVKRGAIVDARSSALQFPKFAFNGSTMVSTPMPRGSMTALLMAARQGALDGVRALVEAGADLDLTEPDGSSALVLAIVNSHQDVAVLLLEKGANPNVADSAGMAALYAALEMRSGGRLINRPSRKPTGLVDSLELVQLILDRGGNPNARLKTPTLQRYHNGGDAQLTDGATPLMRAAKSMDVAAMRLLLDQRADPNLMTKNLTTPLMVAAGAAGARNEADAREAISLCLEYGADVNAFNSTGQTALHIAVERSDAVVRLLVERGAEMDLKDRDGRTPLDIAMGVSASAFQGRRGAAPAVVRETTAALLRQLIAEASGPPPAR